MRPMDFRGRVATSQAFDADRISGVTQRSNFTRWCGFIWALYLESDRRNLRTTIPILAFHFNCKSKMKHQIQRLHPNLSIYMHVFQQKIYSWMFRAIKLYKHLNPWISWFLPLLDRFLRPRSAWNKIFMKMREKLPLECRILSLKS